MESILFIFSQYILSGKKKSHNRTSNYYIASDRAGLDQVGPTFLGKLRSNFVGTEFTIYGPGKNPKVYFYYIFIGFRC